MILWLLFGVLSAAVISFVLWPLFRSGPVADDSSSHDLAVYRDQLNALEDEEARGLIGSEERKAARVELARRLIRESDDEGTKNSNDSDDVSLPLLRSAQSSLLAYLIGGAVAVASVGLYLVVGQPSMISEPRTAKPNRVAVAADKEDTITALVAKVEQRLREKPDDGKGWDVIAPVYFNLQRFDDAVLAYERALSLLGETPKRLAGLARSDRWVNRGVITERARKAYDRLLELQPNDVEAQLWLARAMEQDGDDQSAIAAYRKLIQSSPDDTSLKEFVQKRIAQLEGRVAGAGRNGKSNSGDTDASSAPGGGGSEIGALEPVAGGPSIKSMVEGLAKRLQQDGADFDGWVRLIRSYMVLQRADDAQQALSKARAIFRGDEQKQKTLTDLATELGIDG